LLVIMRTLAALLFAVAGVLATAADISPAIAGEDYSYANRPPVVFPGPKGGVAHVSPFPMSKRSAAVWASDACWRDCTSQAAWRFQTCFGMQGADACRVQLDADDRACLRQCRTRGGPVLNITD
jgi:hypothetical protein